MRVLLAVGAVTAQKTQFAELESVHKKKMLHIQCLIDHSHAHAYGYNGYIIMELHNIIYYR